MAGASIVKATSYPMGVVALDNVARILAAKADALGAQSKVRVTELKRAMNQISRLCCDDRSKASLFTGAVSEAVEGVVLTAGDDQATVMQYVERQATASPTRTPRRCSRPSRRSPPARSA